MNKYRKFFGCIILAISFPLYAEGPTLIQNEEFDMQKCLVEMAQTCVSEVCIKSEHRDCQDNCKNLAQAQCKEKEQSAGAKTQ